MQCHDLSWDDAQSYCSSLNNGSSLEDLVYTLVRPSTASESAWIDSIVQNSSFDGAWIGATRTTPIPSNVDTEVGWYWETSQTTPENIQGVSNWASCHGAILSPILLISLDNCSSLKIPYGTRKSVLHHQPITLCESQPIDCDITYCYLDDDDDGYGDANEVYGTCSSCDSGYVENNFDCNDNNSSIIQTPDQDPLMKTVMD